MDAIEKVADTESMDVFEDIMRRAVCFDYLLKKKILTKAQIQRVLKHKADIQDDLGGVMPVAIGLVLEALKVLDEKERAAFDEEHLGAAGKLMDVLASRKVKRSEKLGPFSYALTN